MIGVAPMAEPPADQDRNRETVPRERLRVGLRPWRLALVWFSGFVALAAVLSAATIARWYQGELERIQEEVHRGEIHSARARIDRLVRFGPENVELDYWRGACEEAGGDDEKALLT